MLQPDALDISTLAVNHTAIANLNDQFRKNGPIPMQWFVTPTVNHYLPTARLQHLLRLVRKFDGFDSDNNPDGEHDFGKIVLDEQTYFWKIDYYEDATCEYASPNPADTNLTHRVLTLMHSADY
jgi:hypothetical protein